MNLLLDLSNSRDWNGHPPATEPEIQALIQAMPLALPQSFLDFLRTFDGGEGGLGAEHEVARIMSAKEIVKYQGIWSVHEVMPGAILFGSDLGDFGLLFDGRQGMVREEYPVIRCPLSSLSWADSEPVCESFPKYFRLCIGGGRGT